MTRSTMLTLTGVALTALVAVVVAFNVINLNEAFGDGPPYYSRTTNMDKWTDPLPVLAVLDALAAIAVAAYVRWWKRSQ
ncbi:hypothetical protein [Paraburkholderia sp. J67]|uniref:hypothetical protein n=1 Tax=Paraburkholderia sp. J67 TaxID=2805435 RepID=UPI002ABDE582|nr:hypothetical protein [Paraburkholderia sp. J67]